MQRPRSPQALLVLLLASCGRDGAAGADATAGDIADAAAAVAGDGPTAALDGRPADGPPPVSFMTAPIYYATDEMTFRVSLEARTPVAFGAAGRTEALVPSPSRVRVAQQLATGAVHVFMASGQPVGSFDEAARPLGWIDEETLLFFDSAGTGTLRRVRIDGSGRRDLPNPTVDPGLALRRAALSPDGAQVALVMAGPPTTPPQPAGAIHVVSTADGAVTHRLDVKLDLGPLWAQDGTLVWVEGRLLGRAIPERRAQGLSPLPFVPCSLGPWAGATVHVATLISYGMVTCNDHYTVRSDGQRVEALGLLTARRRSAPTSVPVMAAASPDGLKLVLPGLSNPGLEVMSADGTGIETVVPGPLSPRALAW